MTFFKNSGKDFPCRLKTVIENTFCVDNFFAARYTNYWAEQEIEFLRGGFIYAIRTKSKCNLSE